MKIGAIKTLRYALTFDADFEGYPEIKSLIEKEKLHGLFELRLLILALLKDEVPYKWYFEDYLVSPTPNELKEIKSLGNLKSELVKTISFSKRNPENIYSYGVTIYFEDDEEEKEHYPFYRFIQYTVIVKGRHFNVILKSHSQKVAWRLSRG